MSARYLVSVRFVIFLGSLARSVLLFRFDTLALIVAIEVVGTLFGTGTFELRHAFRFPVRSLLSARLVKTGLSFLVGSLMRSVCFEDRLAFKGGRLAILRHASYSTVLYLRSARFYIPVHFDLLDALLTIGSLKLTGALVAGGSLWVDGSLLDARVSVQIRLAASITGLYVTPARSSRTGHSFFPAAEAFHPRPIRDGRGRGLLRGNEEQQAVLRSRATDARSPR